MTAREIKKNVIINTVKFFTIISLIIVGFFIPIGEMSGVQSIQSLVENNSEDFDLACVLICVIGFIIMATVRILKRLCSKKILVTNEIELESEYVQFVYSTERWVLVCILADIMFFIVASLKSIDGNNIDYKGFIFLTFVILTWCFFRIGTSKFKKHIGRLEAEKANAQIKIMKEEAEAKYVDDVQMDNTGKKAVDDSKVSVQSLDSLLKYKKLLDDGIITQDEFDKKKKELLK